MKGAPRRLKRCLTYVRVAHGPSRRVVACGRGRAERCRRHALRSLRPLHPGYGRRRGARATLRSAGASRLSRPGPSAPGRDHRHARAFFKRRSAWRDRGSHRRSPPADQARSWSTSRRFRARRVPARSPERFSPVAFPSLPPSAARASRSSTCSKASSASFPSRLRRPAKGCAHGVFPPSACRRPAYLPQGHHDGVWTSSSQSGIWFSGNDPSARLCGRGKSRRSRAIAARRKESTHQNTSCWRIERRMRRMRDARSSAGMA